MPSTVRGPQGRMIWAVEREKKSRNFVEVYFSNDNSKPWEFISVVGSTGSHGGNLASMIRLNDGRIVVTWLPDKTVTVYYFTTKENPEQHIATTIWNPDKISNNKCEEQ